MFLKVKHTAFFLLIVLIGLFFPKSALADTYTLSGVVQNSSGATVVGATIDVYTQGTTTDVVPPTTTDQNGIYSISSIPQGTYDIKVTPSSGSGFSPILAPSKTISSNVVLNFTFAPIGTIALSGYVHDSQGNVLNNQKISLVNSGGSSFPTTTDSSGHFSLQVQASTYRLFIQSPNSGNSLTLDAPEDYVLIVNPLNLTQSESLDIILPADQLQVHVQNSSGTAVSGVELDSNQPQINSIAIGSGLTAQANSGYGVGVDHGPQTDAAGNATLWLFPTGYSLTAKPPSGSTYAITTSGVNVTNSTQQTTVTLNNATILDGFVTDAQGNALGNQKVSLVNSSGSSFPTTTDSSGHFSLNVSPATYTLFFQSPNSGNSLSLNAPEDYALVVRNFNFSQSQTLHIQLPVKEVQVHVQNVSGTAVNGVEIDTNQPTTNSIAIGSGLNAQANSGYGVGVDHGPKTDQSGNAILWLFPTGYSFTSTPPGGSGYAITSTGVNVTDNMQQTITLNGGLTLNGTLQDSQNQPIANQRISLVTSSGFTIPTNTNSSGSFSLQVSPGTYQFYIQSPNNGNALTVNAPQDYGLIVNPFSITQSETLNLVLPLKQVQIHVQDTTGTAVNGVEIDTNQPQLNNISIGSGLLAQGSSGYGVSGDHGPLTNSSGNATLLLLPGTYTFTATPPQGSIWDIFTLGNISVSSNQTELISLQYNHATPVTNANLTTQNSDGTYTDPTNVTLTASAAAGYTVANTYYTIDNNSTPQTYTTPFTVTGAGSHTITYWSVDNGGVQETHNTKTFTITESITGNVFVDANQNGVLDPGETGYSGGTTITLTSGQFSATATTDSNGNYTFTGLPPATYTEQLTVPNRYTTTTLNPVTVGLSTNTTVNFGIVQSNSLVAAINAGGDTQSNFVADTDFSGGSQYSSSATVDTSGISSPAPEAVYQTVRYGNTFSYTIPNLTANGTYTVRLHFNELYWGTPLAGNSGGVGSRVFNVAINGTQVLSNYDIYDKAGGANKAIVEQLPATADANGNITINFTTVTDNAMVNGIELYNGTLPSPSPTPTPTPASSALINAGGNASGNFAADNSYSGGSTYTSGASVDTSNVSNPAPQGVYQSVRYGNFIYNVKNLSASTNYLVRLHFNELYWTSAGSRIFNVKINGSQVLTNYDIYQTAGGANKAVVEDFIVPSDSNGKLALQFISVTDNAMVSGIEIIPPTIPARTYYTANDGTNFSRSTSPFTTTAATQTVNADGSITMNANNSSGYADSGFVLYEGTLGNLPNFTTLGTGDQNGLNIWFDTNNDNEYFAWDANNILTSLNGDTYGLTNGSQNGKENVNGATNVFLISDGQNHTLSDLKNGAVTGIDANTKVAVWVGVNTSNGSTSSTLQSINGL